MTRRDDKARIKGSESEDAALRRKCIAGTERYRLALIAAGYLEPEAKTA